MSTALHAILLAAGVSSRFEGIKQLARFRGESLLRGATIAATQLLGSRVTVVLGANADQLAAELGGLDVRVLMHAGWQQGLGSSLSAGIDALPGNCDAALIMLCDQPLVDHAVLRRLRAAWQKTPDRLIASSYADTLGVPAIIPRSFFGEICNIAGDHGAKSLLLRYCDEVIRVPSPEAAIDVDTPAELAAL